MADTACRGSACLLAAVNAPWQQPPTSKVHGPGSRRVSPSPAMPHCRLQQGSDWQPNYSVVGDGMCPPTRPRLYLVTAMPVSSCGRMLPVLSEECSLDWHISMLAHSSASRKSHDLAVQLCNITCPCWTLCRCALRLLLRSLAFGKARIQLCCAALSTCQQLNRTTATQQFPQMTGRHGKGYQPTTGLLHPTWQPTTGRIEWLHA